MSGTQFPHEKILSPLTCTVDNYDPLPQSIFIPENLRPFIPTTPVYTAPSEGSKYLAPGSPGWFKYLYDQERKTEYRRQRDIQEQESKRKKLEAEKQHKARVANYLHQQMKRRSVFAGKHKNVTKPDIAEKEHAHFEINYLDYVAQTHWIHCTPRSGTSDNTKEIETRQHASDDRFPTDSPAVGPSNSK
ncbi:hypothetical protein RhiirA4_475472 [Rhizophagus irregularis]|uniref:Uncharacterized protein n=1 Tax=Rhizophagus irregularis TaxID=588596 RepID=A0A2I1HA76_9GLOM|nr:hypothetical protein RhiirA4_475472 [Rhizophagus irregularis]